MKRVRNLGMVIVVILGGVLSTHPLAEVAQAAVVGVQVSVNNYTDSGVTAVQITDYIKAANQLLKQAGFLLVPVVTNTPAGPSNLDRTKRDDFRTDGGKELKAQVPNQRGIKIDFVKTVNIDNADVVGVGVHRNPTLIVQQVPGANNAATISQTGKRSPTNSATFSRSTGTPTAPMTS